MKKRFINAMFIFHAFQIVMIILENKTYGISRLFSDSSQGKLCKQDFSRFESVDIQLLIEKQLRESLSEIFLNDLLLLWNL